MKRQLSVVRCPLSVASQTATNNEQRTTDHGPRTTNQSAFTMIEIMVVVGIIAVIMAVAIPSIYRQMHKDSMRQAVADMTEACSQARARAILGGIVTELRIRPGDRTINVSEVGAASEPSFGAVSYGLEGEHVVERRGGGGGQIFTAKISDHIAIDFIGVNLVPDLQEIEEVHCMFYPNGTADEFVILLRSDQGEIRKVTTEVVTGLADVEVIK